MASTTVRIMCFMVLDVWVIDQDDGNLLRGGNAVQRAGDEVGAALESAGGTDDGGPDELAVDESAQLALDDVDVRVFLIQDERLDDGTVFRHDGLNGILVAVKGQHGHAGAPAGAEVGDHLGDEEGGADFVIGIHPVDLAGFVTGDLSNDFFCHIESFRQIYRHLRQKIGRS